jgi:hypothetical protein
VTGVQTCALPIYSLDALRYFIFMYHENSELKTLKKARRKNAIKANRARKY